VSAGRMRGALICFTLIRHCFAMTPSPIKGEGALTSGTSLIVELA
jgi:hypothetical protein